MAEGSLIPFNNFFSSWYVQLQKDGIFKPTLFSLNYCSTAKAVNKICSDSIQHSTILAQITQKTKCHQTHKPYSLDCPLSGARASHTAMNILEFVILKHHPVLAWDRSLFSYISTSFLFASDHQCPSSMPTVLFCPKLAAYPTVVTSNFFLCQASPNAAGYAEAP